MKNNVSPQLRALWELWESPFLFMTPPVVEQNILVGGKVHRFAAWAPGGHPNDATWCEGLSAWIRVTPVTTVTGLVT